MNDSRLFPTLCYDNASVDFRIIHIYISILVRTFLIFLELDLLE